MIGSGHGCLSGFRCWGFDVQGLPFFMLTGSCRIQIGSDDRKCALHVVDHVAPAGIDVANQHPPARVFASVGGFSPEAQNENLVEQRSWCGHEPTFAWRELGTIAQLSPSGHGPFGAAISSGCGPDHGRITASPGEAKASPDAHRSSRFGGSRGWPQDFRPRPKVRNAASRRGSPAVHANAGRFRHYAGF